MTPRQQRFVDEYLVDLNATQAAIRAGYSTNRSDQLALQVLRNTEVAHAIQKKRLALSIRTEVTQDQVIRKLITLAEVSVSMKQPAAAVRAYELIGRHIGMWPREAPQVNIDARSISLGSDIIEAVGGVDGLRRLALPPGDDDVE